MGTVMINTTLQQTDSVGVFTLTGQHWNSGPAVTGHWAGGSTQQIQHTEEIQTQMQTY